MPSPQSVAGLAQFGRAVERHEPISVDVGGVAVPGVGAPQLFHPGKESTSHGPRSKGQEAGSAAGTWSGSRQPQAEAAPGPTPHAVRDLGEAFRQRFGSWQGNGVTESEFEELAEFYPDVELTASSSRFAYLRLTSSPFPALGVQFRFVYEIPRPGLTAAFADQLRRGVGVGWTTGGGYRPRAITRDLMVPAVRAWARWEGGPMHGSLVLSHHQQPDLSICACMHHQWLRGRHLLVDFVSMTVLWAAKVLHEQLIGYYPGPQHYGQLARRERARSKEFCGCGARSRYADCHQAEDATQSLGDLRRKDAALHHMYFEDLMREGRPLRPPAAAWT